MECGPARSSRQNPGHLASDLYHAGREVQAKIAAAPLGHDQPAGTGHPAAQIEHGGVRADPASGDLPDLHRLPQDPADPRTGQKITTCSRCSARHEPAWSLHGSDPPCPLVGSPGAQPISNRTRQGGSATGRHPYHPRPVVGSLIRMAAAREGKTGRWRTNKCARDRGPGARLSGRGVVGQDRHLDHQPLHAVEEHHRSGCWRRPVGRHRPARRRRTCSARRHAAGGQRKRSGDRRSSACSASSPASTVTLVAVTFGDHPPRPGARRRAERERQPARIVGPDRARADEDRIAACPHGIDTVEVSRLDSGNRLTATPST